MSFFGEKVRLDSTVPSSPKVCWRPKATSTIHKVHRVALLFLVPLILKLNQKEILETPNAIPTCAHTPKRKNPSFFAKVGGKRTCWFAFHFGQFEPRPFDE